MLTSELLWIAVSLHMFWKLITNQDLGSVEANQSGGKYLLNLWYYWKMDEPLTSET